MKNTLTVNQKSTLEHLYYAYRVGIVTSDEVSATLERYIDLELTKCDSDIDNNWLDACVGLMKLVDRMKLKRLPNHSLKNLFKINACRWRNRPSRRSFSHLFRSICYVACLVMVTFGVTITVEYITDRQSADGQIYQLTGSEVNISSEVTANAESTGIFYEFETADYEDLCLRLGFAPSLPTWWPEGWSLVSYYVLKDAESITIDVAYSKGEESYVLGYTYRHMKNVASLSVDFFQDGSGQYKSVGSNKKVYFSTNMGQVVAVWIDGNTYSCISGPITVSDAEKMILSIK